MTPRTKGNETRTRAAARAAALVLFLWPSAGCRNCDLVEAELRARDHDLREMREELYRTKAYQQALERELKGLRQHLPVGVLPEEAQPALRSIVLGRQTGGSNHDDQPGDEALQVVLEPRDADGHAIKAPGALAVQVLEVGADGLKKPLGCWQVSPEQLRRTWRSGLWNTGYFLTLPWKAWPGGERLRVVARLTLSDGRAFEAERDVTVRVAPPALRKAPAAADEPLLLPPPRKLESEGKNDGAEPASLWQKAPAVQMLRPIPLNERNWP